MGSTNELRLAREPISAILTQVCAANSKWAVQHLASDVLSHFDCSEVPTISVASFMKQVERAAGGQYWPICLILIDALCRATATPLSVLNVHRLLVTAYNITLKLSIDGTGQSADVARCGGVDLKDLIDMELTFLQLLDWRVTVNPAAVRKLLKKRAHIMKAARVAAATGHLNGPFTIIPGALVPVDERLTLQPVPPAAPSPEKNAHAEADQAPLVLTSSFQKGPGSAFTPNPPTAPKARGVPRPLVGVSPPAAAVHAREAA